MELQERAGPQHPREGYQGDPLASLESDGLPRPQVPQRQQQALAPTDGGYQAWLLLAGCFVINVLVWGFAFSFGVLQEYYASHEPFSAEPNGIAAIGTTATGLMYLLMPVYFSVLQRWPRMKRYSVWASLPLIAGSLIGASFAQSVEHLIACQGVLYALGGNMLFAPTVTYLDEWFVRRKGLAIGIMWYVLP
jgi:MFS family permease